MANAANSSTASDEAEPVTFWTLFKNSPKLHQAFIIVVALQCIAVTIERFWLFALADLSTAEGLRQSVWFLLIQLLSVLHVGYFAVNSVLSANAFEMAAFFVASILLLSRVIVEFVTRSDECTAANADLCSVFLGIAVCFIVAAMMFAYNMYTDLAWKRYKAIGADTGTQRMYKIFELFSAVRKLDVQFSLITLITGLCFVTSVPEVPDEIEWITLGINLGLFVVELLWDVTGVRAVRTENGWLLLLFWSLSAALPSAIIAVAVETATSGLLLATAKNDSVRLAIAVMAALALLNRCATVTVSVWLYRNFGQNYVGLRRIIAGSRKKKFNRGRKTAYAAEPGDVSATPSGSGAGSGAVRTDNPFAVAAAAAADAGAASPHGIELNTLRSVRVERMSSASGAAASSNSSQAATAAPPEWK